MTVNEQPSAKKLSTQRIAAALKYTKAIFILTLTRFLDNPFNLLCIRNHYTAPQTLPEESCFFSTLTSP
jgi:hypothetical protein